MVLVYAALEMRSMMAPCNQKNDFVEIISLLSPFMINDPAIVSKLVSQKLFSRKNGFWLFQ